MTIETGLIIKGEYVDQILAGTKTWEMRSKNTVKRGRVALIKKGTGLIYGAARITDSMELTPDEIRRCTDKHGRPASMLDEPTLKKYRYAWVLADVEALSEPVPYVHKSGAVVFIKLDSLAVQKLQAALVSVA